MENVVPCVSTVIPMFAPVTRARSCPCCPVPGAEVSLRIRSTTSASFSRSMEMRVFSRRISRMQLAGSRPARSFRRL